ncbi:MAG: hypothetical protein QG620_242 [Patescibacteria group bacterium]|nr:hypothetical protein [Patescibacteria group bacterium]
MNGGYWILIIILAVTILGVRLLMDVFSSGSNPNVFIDKWFRKTLWLWLPFYALWRLVKEMILKK